MNVRCPGCNSINVILLPVLIASCACGRMLRAKPPTPEQPQEFQQETASINYYEVLGIAVGATQEEIKSAYRSRAKETHPDVGGDADEFAVVETANRTLADPASRKAYDDEASSEPLDSSIPMPDVLGKGAVVAVKLLAEQKLIARIAIIAVPRGSVFQSRIIGQFPYPGDKSYAGQVVALVMGVAKESTIWQRTKFAVIEAAAGFVAGVHGAVGPRQKQLGNPSPTSTAGQVGQFVGEVAAATVAKTVRTTWAIVNVLAALFGFLVGFVVLLISPPLGVIIIAVMTWAVVAQLRGRKR